MQKLDNSNLLLWNSGGYQFAIELGACREIIRDAELTEVPHSEDFVSGIANIRGAVLGIYDLPTLLGYDSARNKDGGLIIRIKSDHGDFGIGADSVVDAVKITANELRPIPTNFSELESRFVKSIAILPGRVALVVRAGAFDFG